MAAACKAFVSVRVRNLRLGIWVAYIALLGIGFAPYCAVALINWGFSFVQIRAGRSGWQQAIPEHLVIDKGHLRWAPGSTDIG